jgi:hypothetical protein
MLLAVVPLLLIVLLATVALWQILLSLVWVASHLHDVFAISSGAAKDFLLLMCRLGLTDGCYGLFKRELIVHL